MVNVNQDSANTVSPEIQGGFTASLEPVFSKYHRERCYPALIFRQGKRTMLQINVPAGDFPALLVAKPATDDDPESGKQRPEIPGHADDIKNYIIEQVQKNKILNFKTMM
ncbi:DNA sulfur modification protein DndB [Nostoc sp. TCL26-01]|uniref:DNA sulfur modification protein DndB n=1 Tax=Nostoc sp. TCL26-01 TaxID=2576904 RepID=UPI0021175B6C|nr:DNA sulfur modification protein DndB [Nostoc sp. TCL26-01]